MFASLTDFRNDSFECRLYINVSLYHYIFIRLYVTIYTKI